MAYGFNPYMKGVNFGEFGQDTASNIMQWLMMAKMFGNQGGNTTTGLGQTALPPQSSTQQVGAQNMAAQAPSTQNNGMVDYNALMQMLMMLGKR